MKKLKLKITALIMLIAIIVITVLFNGCEKNVSDVYDYVPEVLEPDFTIVKVDYTSDKTEIDSESNLTFKVSYKNNELTNTTYSSVLNFYVDSAIMESVVLKDIISNKDYETQFKWAALAGKHNFRFEINVSSDGSQLVKEVNTSNNAQKTSINVAVKQIVVINEVVVENSVVEKAIAADTSSNIADVIAGEDLKISTTVEPVKTTFNDNTTMVVAALANNDGTIDTSKVVVSFTVFPGVKTGQKQESTSTMVVQTNVEEKKISFYNENEKLTYKNGVLTFEGLKSAKIFTPGTEPSNFEMLNSDPKAVASLTSKITSDILTLGVEKGLEKAPVSLIEVKKAYGYTQGNVDNPAIMSSEIIYSDCSTDCINGVKVILSGYPGFILNFNDDRCNGVVLQGTSDVITSFSKLPNCASSNNGTYIFEDCAGQEIQFVMNSSRLQTITTDPCSEDIHNIHNIHNVR